MATNVINAIMHHPDQPIRAKSLAKRCGIASKICTRAVLPRCIFKMSQHRDGLCTTRALDSGMTVPDFHFFFSNQTVCDM